MQAGKTIDRYPKGACKTSAREPGRQRTMTSPPCPAYQGAFGRLCLFLAWEAWHVASNHQDLQPYIQRPGESGQGGGGPRALAMLDLADIGLAHASRVSECLEGHATELSPGP